MNERLPAVVSAMRRFYLLSAFLLAAAGVGRAQTPPAPPRPPLGATITVDALGELPASANLFSLLDTAVPDVIADRIDTGGLSAGAPARVGAHGSTWTQTLFRVGDVDVTAPAGGAPLLVPGVGAWARVDVATGLMPVDVDAPGLAITMTPRRPLAAWAHTLDLVGSPPFLNAAGAASGAPPIARINSWMHANLDMGGAAVPDRVHMFLTTGLTRSTHFERDGVHQIDANVASLFANVVATPRPGDEIRALLWVQRSRDPVANHFALGQPNAGEVDASFHGQVAWDRVLGDRGTVRGFVGLTTRRRTNELRAPDFVTIERLRDGPVPNLLDAGEGGDRRWTIGARAQSSREISGSRHDVVGGLDLAGASMTQQSTFAGTVGELIDGLPARVWMFAEPSAPSDWRSIAVSAFVADTVAWGPRVMLNGGVRLETVQGARAGDGAAAISWRSLLPRAGVHASLLDFWHLAAFGQYGAYGHRLPLTDLAWGDPTAPTGRVFRWTAPVGSQSLATGALGPLVQRVGPGTGGAAAFSAIDPALERPVMRELELGFEARPHATTFVRLAAIGRRERHLVGVVDVGVPDSMYSTIGVFDPGVDLIGTQDDQILLFYNRSPATFGADRYLLTNPVDDEGTFVGADLVGAVHAKRFYFIAGATAGRSEGLSASRGFGPIENDDAVIGEVFTNPNARVHAQGRLFTERGYTLKTAAAYQSEGGYTFGLVARYQDGQHFARMVIMPDLNQGPEAVRAFRNGRTRFTFSMTVDARLQKSWRVGGRTLSAFADAYNLFNQALEVEEFSVTGATSRLTSAVQPPRVVQVGVKLPF